MALQPSGFRRPYFKAWQAVIASVALHALAPAAAALDFTALTECLGGPGVAPPTTGPRTTEACQAQFDWDADGDVDLRDVAFLVASENSCISPDDCDDGQYCNGLEDCVGGVCRPGDDPCPDQMCNEFLDACYTSLCADGSDPFLPGLPVGILHGSDVDEASGLVASRQNAGVLWTHNDDYNDNRLFAVRMDGTLLGRYTVGSGAVDPEDIAIGPGPAAGVDYLYWADIGDNSNARSTVFIKRVPEPIVNLDQPCQNVVLDNVDYLVLSYPTDSTAPSHRDAETLLVDSRTGDLYVVTKRTSRSTVYRAAYPQSTTATNVLQRIAALPWSGATGGDISPDGSLILIRRYGTVATVWQRTAAMSVAEAFTHGQCDVGLASEPQGEAICWDADGQGYLTVSENSDPGALIPIWYFARN